MRASLLAFLLLLTGPAAAQEKFVGSTIDVRTILNFKVSDAALKRLLPPSWELNAVGSGATADTNLRVTFADQLAGSDASGKQIVPVQYVTFSIPVRKPGVENDGYMIFAGLSPGGPGPYGTNSKSTSTVDRKLHHELGKTIAEESWEYVADDGSTVSLRLQYDGGAIARLKSEIRNYSLRKPDFFRVYRYEEAEDVVSSAELGTSRLLTYKFSASGGLLSSLFDGTEKLISVVSVPWYAREIYVPGR